MRHELKNDRALFRAPTQQLGKGEQNTGAGQAKPLCNKPNMCGLKPKQKKERRCKAALRVKWGCKQKKSGFYPAFFVFAST